VHRAAVHGAAVHGAGGEDAVEFRERDVRLRHGAAVLLGHPGPGAAVRVGRPRLG
jgi:hypothetical protein